MGELLESVGDGVTADALIAAGDHWTELGVASELPGIFALAGCVGPRYRASVFLDREPGSL